MDPSPALLQASGGAIVHTGFLYCHKFFAGSGDFSPLQPMVQMKLGQTTPPCGNTNVTVNFGKLWSVLKQSGRVQCMVDGKPETLLSIVDCSSIKIQNPQMMKEGSDYCIKMFNSNTVYVLRAELPTDHFEWTLAIEKLLQEHGKAKILVRDKCRESGYVALKRLMSLQHNGGIRGSQLISPMTELEALQDLYDESMFTKERASPDGCEEKKMVEASGPPVPPRGSSAPPPPLPPRDPPPLPPKRGNSLQRIRTPSMASTTSNGSVDYDEYVIMQPPTSLKFSSPIHCGTSGLANCSIPSPITEGDDYMPMKPAGDHGLSYFKENAGISSQPISIPGPSVKRTPSTKRSILLRSTSDSDSGMTHEATPPLPPRGPSPRFSYNSSFSNSLTRHPSGSSINSLNSSPSNVLSRSGNERLYQSTLLDRGNTRPVFIPRSNSTVVPPVSPIPPRLEDTSVSDGIMAREARERYNQEVPPCHSYVGSVSSVLSSENGLDISGLSSSSSSMEDVTQVSGW